MDLMHLCDYQDETFQTVMNRWFDKNSLGIIFQYTQVNDDEYKIRQKQLVRWRVDHFAWSRNWWNMEFMNKVMRDIHQPRIYRAHIEKWLNIGGRGIEISIRVEHTTWDNITSREAVDYYMKIKNIGPYEMYVYRDYYKIANDSKLSDEQIDELKKNVANHGYTMVRDMTFSGPLVMNDFLSQSDNPELPFRDLTLPKIRHLLFGGW